MASVKLENLTKRFDDVIALDGINLDIVDHEFFVLLGQTGAGKTTALRCVAGLERADGGAIFFDGQQVDEYTPAERDVAFVFQSHILYPHLTVYENMAFPLHPRKLSADEIDARVREIAAMLHIEPLLGRKPSQLSGGETQRVGLGRAMVRRPKLFLMDEPISNLDAKLRSEMRAEIKWRQRQLGTTMLYVTHDQIEAMSMADRVAVLEAGRIHQIGTPMDIYNSPVNLFVAGFIGNPSMNLLPCDLVADRDRLTGRLTRNVQFGITDAAIVHGLSESAGNGRVVFGVRPEDVIVSQQAMPDAIALEVYGFEPLGAETIVELIIGKNEKSANLILRASAPATLNVNIGQTLNMKFVPDRLHFFNQETGEAI
ncbi:MAG: ABC transporter ATP-binding protein [Candidatus Poribacteria bacterium]|nr:ABC transporter ATP-binding protein [Candidatus Poribacteria bacterium]MDE0504154.1 ABC transporter ATP-binding protein [Candidatus Poribacteria bacterium]